MKGLEGAASRQPHHAQPQATRNLVPPVPLYDSLVAKIDNFNDMSFLPSAAKSLNRSRRSSCAFHPKPSPSGAAAGHNLGRTVLDHTVSRSLTLRQVEGFQRFRPYWSIAVCRSILPLQPIGPSILQHEFAGPCIEAGLP